MLGGCGDQGTLLHCCWDCQCIQPRWRTVWGFLKILKLELLCDPAVLFLGISREPLIWKNACTPVFITALFTIAKNETTFVCISHTYKHNGILLSHKKKQWNNAICSNMDEPRDDHTKWSQKEQISYDISYMRNL